MKRPAWIFLLSLIGAIGSLNVMVFVFGAMYLGGTATLGHIVDGHYFLGNHGKYTQVSRSVYYYSIWQARSLWLTLPPGAIAALILHIFEGKGRGTQSH